METKELPDEEIELITGNRMLTDLTIDKCQKILKNQFHAQYGLQDTVLGQKLMFKEQKGEFVQILHNGNYQWVAISNINCSKDEINSYDSLYFMAKCIFPCENANLQHLNAVEKS